MARTNLANKVIWITGASSGIGEAVAYELAMRGARLVLSARRGSVLETVRSKCRDPALHLVQPLDLLQPDSFGENIEAVYRHFGRIDMLIHNAGISQRGTAIHTELKVDRHLMELNYFGPVALTKQVLPKMLIRGEGQVVVVSSLLGKFAVPGRAAYAASKHALHGFFDALRAEVEMEGITVTMVCPGFVRTNASFNALGGDGTPHNQMDAEIDRGLSPDACARRIARAIERRRREVYLGRKEVLGLYLSRFAPGWFHHCTRLKRKT